MNYSVKDKIIFNQLDIYDELLNLQVKTSFYTNNIKPSNDRQFKFYSKHVLIDRDQILSLMYSTIDQAKNSSWRLQRQKRISASSKAHKIHTRRSRNEDLAIQFLKHNTIRGKGLKYVEYGIGMEDFAYKKYSHMHNVDEIIKCGLVVHQKQPWICASPDGLIINSKKVKKLLEIKCPYTCKDTLLIDEKSEKINIPYLQYNKEKKIILKQNHNYFTQCQIQMYCTGLEECDLFVCTKQDCITVPVKRDNLFLEKLVKKMEYFFFNYYLPKLTDVYF